MPKDRCAEDGSLSERYLPYCMELTEPILNFARTHLNETPERRAQCIKEIREKLNENVEELNYRNDDLFLLNFLRSRKFDVGRALSMILKYYSFIESHRDIFRQANPEAVHKFVKANIVGYLPYRDQQNKAIILIRAESWNVDEFPADDVMFGGIVALRSSIEMATNQVMGFIAIFDLKNLSLKQILSIAPKYAVFAAQGLQYCCPCKVSAIHFVNVPEIFRIAWKILKPVISEKIKKRITFHKNDNYERLHQQIPKAILPLELGGDSGPFSNSHWAKNVDKMQLEYNEEVKHGFKNWKKSKHTNKLRSSLLTALGISGLVFGHPEVAKVEPL